VKEKATKKYFQYALILSFVIAPLFSGCAPIEIRADYYQKGFDYYNLGYTHLPESLPLNETIEIENLRVIIVGSIEDFERYKFKDEEDETAPHPKPRHEIWIVGKKLKNKIIINQVVLGHELLHLMHLIDPDVICPGKLETFEACILLRSHIECE